VNGYRKIHSDLRAFGESFGINRVYRLMQSKVLKAQVGYRKPRYRKGYSYIIAPNRLQR
jgi:putative transposase